MKKFKGGLYADLGNYKTSLPNTEILNNFFASNPVGYRNGGIVRGVAGGNPTGMQVTGGFLANAQRLAKGTNPYDPRRYVSDIEGDMYQSSYYRDKDVSFAPKPKNKLSNEDLVKYGVLKKVPKYKEVKIGRGEARKVIEGYDYVPTNEGYIPPEAYYDQSPGFRQKFPEVTEELTESEMMETPMSDNDAKLMSQISRLRATKPEGYEAEIQKILTLPESEGGISKFTKNQMSGNTPKPEEEKSNTTTAYTGGEGSSRMGDDGITGISLEELKKQKKEAKKKKKYKSVNDFLNDTESTSSVTSELDSMKNGNASVDSGDSAYPDAPTIEDADSDPNKIFNDLMEKGGIQEIIEGNKVANAEDIKNINAIGKGFYDSDGKDAPAWAMPLMMAGLKMAASDNPDMLGALAEGGIKGLEQYAKQQKEKKDDAKDQIELDLKKVDAIQKIKGRDIDIATLQTNMFSTATSVAASNMRQFREIELAKWTKDVDIVNVTKDRLFKKQQHSDTVDLEIAKLKQNQNQFESTDEYKKAVYALEVIKASTQEEQHELEMDLKYRDTGKVVDVMISDESGIPKKAEIRSYYSYKDNEFKTEFIGWSPLSSSEFTTLQDEIYDIASKQLEGILDDKDYATKYETLVNKLWTEKMIKMFGTVEGAEKALNMDLGNTDDDGL